jgi:DnaJ homolog subfamily C member 10
MKTIIKIDFKLLLILLITTSQLVTAGGGGKIDNESLYKLLGVAKTATVKEIRISFKKIALEKHPDKNTHDPSAHDEFIKINRAYEILKDEEQRKKYDKYGEEGLKDSQNQGHHSYQNWNFYQNIGIYDDDPQVITLTRSDFMQNVNGNKDTIWFINYYSTQCSHCHDLAPTWRELAKQLEGVVKIGAINCMDDWLLCNEQRIMAFPSLIIYPQRELFEGDKSLENLLNKVMSLTKGKVVNLSKYNDILEKEERDRKEEKQVLPWLINYCLTSDENNDKDSINYELNCLDDIILHKLAIMMNGFVQVGRLNCNEEPKACSKLNPPKHNPLVYSKTLQDQSDDQNRVLISTSDYKMIFRVLLNLMPDIETIDLDSFNEVLANLKVFDKKEKPILIQFVNGDQNNNSDDLEMRKLPSILEPSEFSTLNFKFVNVENVFNIKESYHLIEKRILYKINLIFTSKTHKT